MNGAKQLLTISILFFISIVLLGCYTDSVSQPKALSTIGQQMLQNFSGQDNNPENLHDNTADQRNKVKVPAFTGLEEKLQDLLDDYSQNEDMQIQYLYLTHQAWQDGVLLLALHGENKWSGVSLLCLNKDEEGVFIVSEILCELQYSSVNIPNLSSCQVQDNNGNLYTVIFGVTDESWVDKLLVTYTNEHKEERDIKNSAILCITDKKEKIETVELLSITRESLFIQSFSGVEEIVENIISKEIQSWELIINNQQVDQIDFCDSRYTKLRLLHSLPILSSGSILEIWQYDFAFKPLVPDKVILSGGMIMEKGWLSGFYSGYGCGYLLLEAELDGGHNLLLNDYYEGDDKALYTWVYNKLNELGYITNNIH